jgi:hypothetical protein
MIIAMSSLRASAEEEISSAELRKIGHCFGWCKGLNNNLRVR